MTIYPPKGTQNCPDRTTASELVAAIPQSAGGQAPAGTGEGAAANEQAQSCLGKQLKLSFGIRANDNRPSPRTITFGDLIQEFSKPDAARGTLSAAEYHALDKGDPLQKAQRSVRRTGRISSPVISRVMVVGAATTSKPSAVCRSTSIRAKRPTRTFACC